jgi:hypothetical protein
MGIGEESVRIFLRLVWTEFSKVDGPALFVDSQVEVFSDALDLDVRFVHAPAAADRTLVFPGHFSSRSR